MTTTVGIPDRSTECVVLLHGLGRSGAAMKKMEVSLLRSGYHVANISYPSRQHKIEELAEIAVKDGLDVCFSYSTVKTIHFATHSLGGILVRQYYENREVDDVGRVVMLGPPNQGSRAADAMRGVPGFGWFTGPAGMQLGKGSESVPLKLGRPEFEFAVIAGNRTIDPITSAELPDPDDGKVSVADTKLEGMRDFIVLPVSHAFMMQDENVFDLIKLFLVTGRFSTAPVHPDLARSFI